MSSPLSLERVTKDAQDNQEELVTGDTPPGPWEDGGSLPGCSSRSVEATGRETCGATEKLIEVSVDSEELAPECAAGAAAPLGCSSQPVVAVEGTRGSGSSYGPRGEIVQPNTDPLVAAAGLASRVRRGVSPAPGRVAAAARAVVSRRARAPVAEPAGLGRRALRAAMRAQVSAPGGSPSLQSFDSFEQCFRPYRRVINSDTDLASVPVPTSSVSCPSVSSRSVGRFRSGARGLSACCSRCGGALVGGLGALCGVCAADVRGSMATSGDDHRDHNSWKHGPQIGGGRKALFQCTGTTAGRTFVDTHPVLRASNLRQRCWPTPAGHAADELLVKLGVLEAAAA